MEYIIIILFVILIIYLLYLLLVKVLLPIAGVLGLIILAISAGYAFIVSLICFIKSIVKNINPYVSYVDKKAYLAPGIKRNYCFGPGFHHIAIIVKGAFTNLAADRAKLTSWMRKAVRHIWYVDVWIYLTYGFAISCLMVFGCIWVTLFSTALSIGIFIGMLVFLAFFSVLWLIDRTVLFIKAISCRCPNCKHMSVIPDYLCPSCGAVHKSLIPGPYGLFRRKCVCGKVLATTFISGRSEYTALCSRCGTELLSSKSQQFGIQLIGGVGTGKTSFLAAFWHEYKAWLDQRNDISYEVKPSEAFNTIEEWFDFGGSESTLETNASMYSIIHQFNKNVYVQMSIYDIAGEVFEYANSEIQQQQIKYCEGFLVVIDPKSSPNNVSSYIANFVKLVGELKVRNATKRTSVPVAVIITKSDLFKKEIGLSHIKALYSAIPDTEDKPDMGQFKDAICRKFLNEKGYSNAINLLESKFSNVKYFPVSSMGHEAEFGRYEPWGVLEPVFWLMTSNHNSIMHNMLIK